MFLVDWAVKMRIRPPEFETSICDVKYHASLSTRCVLGKCVYLVTLTMSLFDLQDVCIAIGSIATLDLPMVVDLIGIYGLKGTYCTLTTTNWFLQALSVIPRGSWGDVARRSYHDSLGSRRRRLESSKNRFRPIDEENPFVLISSVLLVQADEGVLFLVVDRIGDFYRNLPRRADVIVTTVGARHKCQQAGGRIRIPNNLICQQLVNQIQRLDFSTTQQIPATGANTPAADFLALTKTTSPKLIQTMAYCTSLQELAANRYHPVYASQNVTVWKSLALSAESTSRSEINSSGQTSTVFPPALMEKYRQRRSDDHKATTYSTTQSLLGALLETEDQLTENHKNSYALTIIALTLTTNQQLQYRYRKDDLEERNPKIPALLQAETSIVGNRRRYGSVNSNKGFATG
ncbi:TMV resistance protein N-like [Dorcoceras hygrometricum]|uniref:TMV resistance protein N-like n=1 Tax=Dorcoceras hygrometricum TaxID=472368 RepID=A0A2Z7CSH8_9LAMI|nr:TMV resistance protein N-like [Dorcoceras hygrometricum]